MTIFDAPVSLVDSSECVLCRKEELPTFGIWRLCEHCWRDAKLSGIVRAGDVVDVVIGGKPYRGRVLPSDSAGGDVIGLSEER